MTERGGADAAGLHERAGAIFVRLRRLAPAERAAALDEACAGDAALRNEVSALLDADTTSGLDADRLGQHFQGVVRQLLDAPAPPRPMPARIGGFRIVRHLGEGGMGTVYEAVAESGTPGLAAGTPVALKVLHAHIMEAPGALERMRREGLIGQSIRHANVVRTLDCSSATDDGHRSDYLVMELVEGQTLHELQQELGTVPEELCRHVAREAAVGLAAIHAAGIVHRDLKPENMFITTENVVKIMDLGIARATSDAARLTRTGAFVGSLQHAAPEQLGGSGQLDGRADLYSLGVVLYELFTGSNPFRDEDWHGAIQRVLTVTPPRLGVIRPEVTPFFEELVRALLEKNRERRIASADELAEILELGEESLWWMTRSQAIRETARRPLRRVRIPRETALVGRGPELAMLRAAFLKARDGEGQVVLVEGEAGIGKTRLVDEAVALLHDEGEDLDFLHGSYPPGGAAGAASALAAACREHFGEHELDEAIGEHLAEAPALAPAFAALLAGRPLPAGAQPLTPSAMQACFVPLTRAIAAERVAVVLVDDLHLAPAEGRALFASLARAVPGSRILLVGTARPSLDAAWAADLASATHAARISVARLSTNELSRLLAEALDSRHLADELTSQLAEATHGNPFFAFEVLRWLKECQCLVQRPDGTWAMTKELRELAIPPSISSLIRARLGELPPDERRLLEIAAHVGFEFEPAKVGEVAGLARIPLLKSLAVIERKHGLILPAGRRYVFEHELIHEQLRAGLDGSVR